MNDLSPQTSGAPQASGAQTSGALETFWARHAWGLEACGYALAAAIILALGAANLFLPFGPDQAVFFYGAKLLDQGALYYVDYWDNKQPGLYLFYLLAGRAFGFSEFGIHLLELLWMLAFAVTLMVGLRSAFRQRWLSAVVPVATIGVYYAAATEHELTQLEFLVSFPLFALALCLLSAQRHPRALVPLYFVSGLLAGLAVVFKLLLAPLCVGLWLVALGYQFWVNRQGLAALLLRAVLPASAGVVLVLGSVVLLYAHWGHLDALLWTTFVYPPQALAFSPPASKSRLVTAAAFFILEFGPWACFALFAALAWIWSRRDLLSALMLTWFVIGTALFIVQRFSWWEYHTLLVFFPAGVLAVAGIDRFSAWLGGTGREVREAGESNLRSLFIAAAIALTASTSLTSALVRKARPLISTVVMSGHSVQTYQSQITVSEHYARIYHAARFVNGPNALPGPIYSFGSAMIYAFTGRPSPHVTAGSSWEFYLPEQIDDILAALDDQQVPYVFVDRFDMKLFRLRPKIAAYLERNYVRDQRDGNGIWFRRRSAGDQA